MKTIQKFFALVFLLALTTTIVSLYMLIWRPENAQQLTQILFSALLTTILSGFIVKLID